MGTRVEVQEGETLSQALRRLRKKLEVLSRRRGIKGQTGRYFEKACEIRRRLEYEKRRWKMNCNSAKN